MKTITNSFHVGMYIFLCTQYINEIQLFLPQMFETNKINDFSSEVIAYCFKGIDAKKALIFKGLFQVLLKSNINLQFTAFFCMILQHVLGNFEVGLSKHLLERFIYFLFFPIVDFGTFLVRLMNSYLTFSSLLFQVCVCYVLNQIFAAGTLKTLHKYGNTYLNSTEFIAVCMQK